MGAFLAVREGSGADWDSARTVFSKKGLAGHRILARGQWRIAYWRKMLVDENGVFEAPSGDVLVCCGTLIYNGRTGASAYALLLDHLRSDSIDRRRLRGCFAALAVVGKELQILLDGSCVRSVFAGPGGACISTSFLAVVAATRSQPRVSQLACQQKFVLGYILRPSTAVEGIMSALPGSAQRLGDGVRVIDTRPESAQAAAAEHLEAAVDLQLSALRRWVGDCLPLLRHHRCDLGLSGGYDSRLLALLLAESDIEFSVHTHLQNHSATHQTDLSIVQSLASILGVPLRVVPSPSLDELGEDEIAAVCEDNLFYSDGRTGDNGGGVNPTYTLAYRRATLGDAWVRLNGEGGEIFRNYFASPPWAVSLERWLRHRVCYAQHLKVLASHGGLEHLLHRTVADIGDRLQCDCTRRVEGELLRRYYGEIHLPDCEGFIADAESQQVHILFPFADAQVVRTAIGLHRFVGVGAALEEAMICRLSDRAAAIPIHAGYPIGKEPRRAKLMWLGKVLLPGGWWTHWRTRSAPARRSADASTARFERLRSRSRVLTDCEEAFRSFLPGICFSALMKQRATAEAALSFGNFLRVFGSKLRVS